MSGKNWVKSNEWWQKKKKKKKKNPNNPLASLFLTCQEKHFLPIDLVLSDSWSKRLLYPSMLAKCDY